jgi:two-component system sensor histidine kinase BaeS
VRRGAWHGNQPPWWPQDMEWPPRGGGGSHWQTMRGRFIRRFVFLFFCFVAFSVLAATALFWIAATALGLVDPSGTLARGAVVVIVLLGLLGLVFTAGAVRRVAAPVGDMIEAAGRVEAGDYSVRVGERGPREVRALAHAFNAMTARLEASEEQRRRLLADVTHELRAPLTVMQGNLEALLDGVYPADAAHVAPILEETRVLARLIDDLRTLSLAEAGALTLHREPTDLGTLARETLASFRPQADRAGVALDVGVEGAAPVANVDPLRTREVLANLVANAIRYTPSGGAIRVAVAPNGGTQVAISVRDSGPGIAPEALPRVFDRFYKSPESRGAGLGLAIAKSLVVAQGGEIAATSAPGRGTEIRFTLPIGP